MKTQPGTGIIYAFLISLALWAVTAAVVWGVWW
jgi:hypothetical protein